MVYALNVFNLVEDHEDEYADYSVRAGKIIYGLGGRVLASGWNPLRNLQGDRERRYFIVVEFPSEQAFQQFLDEGDRQGIHHLRRQSTADYLWTLYEPWDLRTWVKQERR